MKRLPFLTVYHGLPRSMYILFISRVVNSMGSFILPLMTLILTEQLGFSKANAGLFATVYITAQVPFLLLGGKLSDHWGSRRVIIVFDTLGALTYLLCAFVGHSSAAAGLIILAACFFSGANPAFNSMVAEIAPTEKVGASYSLIYLAYNFGYAVGPTLGGLLFSRLWLLFLIDALTTMLATLLIVLFLPAASVQQPIKKQEETSGLSLFAVLKATPILLAFSFAILIYYMCYSQWSFLLPLQMADLFEKNGARFYSLLVSVNAICVLLATPGLTHLTKKRSPASVIAAGGLFYCASFALFGFNLRSFQLFLLAAILLTIGEILVTINVNSYIALRTPKTHLGRVNSLLTIVSGSGTAVAPAVMGGMLLVTGYRSAWLWVAGIMLLGVLFIIGVGRADGTAPVKTQCSEGHGGRPA